MLGRPQHRALCPTPRCTAPFPSRPAHRGIPWRGGPAAGRSPRAPIGCRPVGPRGPLHAREAVIESGNGKQDGASEAAPEPSGSAAAAVTETRPARPTGGRTAAPSSAGIAERTADWTTAWQPEEPAILSARQRAAEVGVGAVDAPTGALLRMFAASTQARAVVELGTGAGVSSLWLLAGMRPDGILTSVDSESEHQRLAKLSLAEAGVAPGRARLIGGRALEVLPRLSDAAYDLLFCDAARSENADYVDAALRLLRPGGLLVFAGALVGGKVGEPAARDAETLTMRELARTLRDEPRLVAAAVPVGTGLLVAAVTD